MEINRENFFHLLYEKRWIELLNILKENDSYVQIKGDSILSNAIDQVFTDAITAESNDETFDIKFILSEFYILHASPNYNFQLSESNIKKIILRLMDLDKNINQVYKYALMYPTEPKSIEIIKRYKEEKANVISHSLENKLYVTQNKNISSNDARIGLFKSKQEFNFYQAVIERYPTYLVLPNVALSAVLDYDSISHELTVFEKDFFWKGLIDCVIINTTDSYKAIAFYELDSYFHDSEEQKKRDRLKDSILSKSGQILERIRPKKDKCSKNDYLKYLRENKEI